MIGSPLEAYPLRTSSSCRSSVSRNDERDSPPRYVAQQAPPPYLPRASSTTTPQPRTKSIPFGTGVTIEWERTAPRSPEDIIIVTIRVNKLGRRLSFDDPLPERPAQRGFFRRLSSRIMCDDRQDNLRVVRMPRSEYERYHKRDKDGNYAGSEPKQEWDDAMIASAYGRYQHTPLGGLYHNAAMRY